MGLKFDRVLLDNMSLNNLKKAVKNNKWFSMRQKLQATLI
jgi:nicotinate-nucleotide pyrophosphorylase